MTVNNTATNNKPNDLDQIRDGHTDLTSHPPSQEVSEEAPWEGDEVAVPEGWPSQGKIEMENVVFKCVASSSNAHRHIT